MTEFDTLLAALSRRQVAFIVVGGAAMAELEAIEEEDDQPESSAWTFPPAHRRCVLPCALVSNKTPPGLDHPTWLVTGANATHFVNSKMLVASWWRNDRSMPLLYCDYGLTPSQRTEVLTWPVHLIDQPAEFQGLHGWRSKAGLARYLASAGREGRHLIWIDADAILLRKLPPMEELLGGYDLAIDPHPMSIAEVVAPESIELLSLSGMDAYYSSGFWMTSSPALIAEWDRLVELVFLKGNLWENDAFAAAVYQNGARIRPLCGNIWHARGATSLETAEVRDGELCYQGIPIQVLHANSSFTVRADGRRVLNRPQLAAIQDRYEAEFEACLQRPGTI